MIKLINLLKEMMKVNSKGELTSNTDKFTDKESTQYLKNLGFDVVNIKDEDIHWYWSTLNNKSMVGPSSNESNSILELPIMSEEARKNYINSILRYDNLWMKKRPKEKANYKDYDLFDYTHYYFVNKEGKMIGFAETLDELIEQAKKDPKKFINCMLKQHN